MVEPSVILASRRDCRESCINKNREGYEGTKKTICENNLFLCGLKTDEMDKVL